MPAVRAVVTIAFSSALVSAVTFTGAALQPNVNFSNVSIDDVGFDSFRSANFAEATNGAILTGGGGGVVNFGAAASPSTPMNNNFNAASLFGPVSLLNGDVTLAAANTSGNWHLKGFGLQTDFSYEFTVVPEPSSLMVLLAFFPLAMRRRR